MEYTYVTLNPIQLANECKKFEINPIYMWPC